jgi:hypothetical protein
MFIPMWLTVTSSHKGILQHVCCSLTIERGYHFRIIYEISRTALLMYPSKIKRTQRKVIHFSLESFEM